MNSVQVPAPYATLLQAVPRIPAQTSNVVAERIMQRDREEREGMKSELLYMRIVDKNAAESDERESRNLSRVQANWVALFYYPDRIVQTYLRGASDLELRTNVLATVRASDGEWEYLRNIGE